MQMLKRCPSCIGTGEIMGGGMQMQRCPKCYGDGEIQVEVEVIINKSPVKPEVKRKRDKEVS